MLMVASPAPVPHTRFVHQSAIFSSGKDFHPASGVMSAIKSLNLTFRFLYARIRLKL
jgi:hypothetical protein